MTVFINTNINAIMRIFQNINSIMVLVNESNRDGPELKVNNKSLPKDSIKDFVGRG
jgi:hypothetical protein